MKVLSMLLALTVMLLVFAHAETPEVLTAEPHRVRTIITIDSEIGDQCSLVRCMFYSNIVCIYIKTICQ